MKSHPAKQLTWKAISYEEHRYGHTSTSYKHYIISFGGTKPLSGALVEHISILNLKTFKNKEIRLKDDDQEAHRWRHSACLLGDGQIIIFGGRSSHKTRNDTAIIDITYNPNNDSISLKWRNLPTKGAEDLFRYDHIAHIYQQQMFVFGGSTGKDRLSINELWFLNFQALTWTKCKLHKDISSILFLKAEYHSRFPLGGLAGHSSVLYKDQIFVFGGRTDDNKGTVTNNLWALDLKEMKWSFFKAREENPYCRVYSAMQVHNGKIYLFGGKLHYNGRSECSNQLFCYDVERNVWQSIRTNRRIPGRFCHTLNSYENLLIVNGGCYVWDLKSNHPEYCFYLPIEEKSEEAEVIKGETENQMFRALFYDKSMTDVRFVIQGREIKAHKAILAAGCPFFRNMFTSGMMESKAKVIEINNVKFETFKALIEFIYCSEVTIDEDLAYNLLGLSDKYALKELRKRCELFLSKRIKRENYGKLVKIVNLLQLPTLEQSLKEYFKHTIDES